MADEVVIPRAIAQQAAVATQYLTGSPLATERVMQKVLSNIFPDLMKWAMRPPVMKREDAPETKRKRYAARKAMADGGIVTVDARRRISLSQFGVVGHERYTIGAKDGVITLTPIDLEKE